MQILTKFSISCGRFCMTVLAALKTSTSPSARNLSRQMERVQKIPARLTPSLEIEIQFMYKLTKRDVISHDWPLMVWVAIMPTARQRKSKAVVKFYLQPTGYDFLRLQSWIFDFFLLVPVIMWLSETQHSTHVDVGPSRGKTSPKSMHSYLRKQRHPCLLSLSLLSLLLLLVITLGRWVMRLTCWWLEWESLGCSETCAIYTSCRSGRADCSSAAELSARLASSWGTKSAQDGTRLQMTQYQQGWWAPNNERTTPAITRDQ